jgi:hypothetical protein
MPSKKKMPTHEFRPMTVRTRLVNSDVGISNPGPRAVYLSRRPCLQTFTGFGVRYLNLLLRLLQHHLAYSHWGIIISKEHPPAKIKPGKTYHLKQDIDTTSSSFDFEVKGERKNGNIGCLERYFPTTKIRSKKLVYIGTTTLTDEEIQVIADSACDVMKLEEGDYHGIYRNCQHFAKMLIAELCPEMKCPKGADHVLWGLAWQFKGRKLTMEDRITQFKNVYEEKLEKKQKEKPTVDDDALVNILE